MPRLRLGTPAPLGGPLFVEHISKRREMPLRKLGALAPTPARAWVPDNFPGDPFLTLRQVHI